MQNGDVVHGVTIDKVKLQQISLLIATPMQGGNCTGVYAASLSKLVYSLRDWEIQFSYLYYENESLVPRARNEIAVEFLNTLHTHVLLLDADIGFEAGNILAMMAHEKGFIAAPYPLKKINWEKVKAAARDGATEEELKKIAASDFVVNYLEKDFDLDQAVRVSEAGAGCMLLSRTVFEDMVHYYPGISYRAMRDRPTYKGRGWDFFGVGKGAGNYYQPEDYTFCQRWRKLGGEIWLCPWMTLTHRGAMNFTGNMKYAFLSGGKFNLEKEANLNAAGVVPVGV